MHQFAPFFPQFFLGEQGYLHACYVLLSLVNWLNFIKTLKNADQICFLSESNVKHAYRA